MKLTCLSLISLLATIIVQAQTTIVPFGSAWKYLDNGTNQATAWRTIAYSDASWPSGNAQLGYGDGDEAKVVSYGPNSSSKYITTYFRKAISVTTPSNYISFSLSIKRDDGAVIYINGTEVYRTNMPSGTISYTTLASAAASDDGNTAQTAMIANSYFVNGTNVIAVEMHQNAGSSSDLSFDLQLTANKAPLAKAGTDQAITLPTNSVTLNGTTSSDPDGTISTYAWTKLSGPSSGTIASASSATTAVNSLVQGVYSFQLKVTDNSGATALDTVAVTVNPGTVLTTTTVMDYGASWKYLANGTNQGTAWTAAVFSDASWSSGNGQLGFGDGDEATVVGYGPDANNKYVTTYFRKTLSIPNAPSYSNFTLNVKRDDGIVVYVNGVEVYRNNMPTGTIAYTTLASAAASDDGGTVQTATIASSYFLNGNNTIAVEVHQNAGTSSDLSFDMQLIANVAGSATLTRGPYLQMGNGTAMTLRWRTNIATNSKIDVGTAFGTYTLTATNATSSTEHEVRITGLTADTKYYYRFGSSTQSLQSANTNYFITAPPASTVRKIRIAAYGDCGINTNGFQSGALSAYQAYVGSNPAELMLLLGDNAYNAGTDAEYTSNFFNAYSGNILKNHVVFPAPGNHDYANSSSRQTDHNIPYYSIFTMPTAAECGGVASGTEAFYSYNWGNIHFLSLDSYGYETGSTRLYDTTGPQVTWVKNDLAANTNKWTIAYWHHPPYTMGSHTSDTETELVNIRQRFIKILERNGVDMIICGHSHDYERSYLLKGYYGNEASFSLATHAASSSSAKYDGTSNSCPYNIASGKVNHGTVYVVAGSAGADGGVQSGYPHNALPFSVDDGGMLYFEVENNRLDAKFIRRDGTIADKFTIVKDASKNNTVNITSGANTVLTASWIGAYSWSTGATTRSITVNPTVTTTYTCGDGSNCLKDTFKVNVTAGFAGPPAEREIKSGAIAVFPVPVKKGEKLTIYVGAGNVSEVVLVNALGKKILTTTVHSSTTINTGNLPQGVYFIRALHNKKTSVKKVLITE